LRVWWGQPKNPRSLVLEAYRRGRLPGGQQ